MLVAAAHPLTAQSAQQVLAEGGNAFDAAMAAALTACVSEPLHASLGGGGLLVLTPAGQTPRVYDFYPRAPRRLRDPAELVLEEFAPELARGARPLCAGPGTAAIPGLAAGLFALHADLGHMPVSELAGAAARAALEGCPLTKSSAGQLTALAPLLSYAGWPDGVLALAGRPDEPQTAPQPAAMPSNAALADFIEVLAIEGPALFYRGEAGQAMVEALGGAGQFDMGDLATCEVEARPVWTQPGPNGAELMLPGTHTAGGALRFAILMQALSGTDAVNRGSARATRAGHRLDAFYRVTEARLDKVAATPGGDPSCPVPASLLEMRERLVPGRFASLGTATGIAIADAAGSVVSMTLGNGQGAGTYVSELGMSVNNLLGQDRYDALGLDDFSAAPYVAASAVPVLAREPDGTMTALAVGGAVSAMDALAHCAEGLLSHAVPLEDVIASPRVRHHPDHVVLEGPLDEDRDALLLEAWPDHLILSDLDAALGGINAVRSGPAGYEAARDPRWDIA